MLFGELFKQFTTPPHGMAGDYAAKEVRHFLSTLFGLDCPHCDED